MTYGATASEATVGGEPMAEQDSMTLREAQARVDASICALGGYWPPLANLARLFEECGELARAVNQAYGPKLRKPGEAAVSASDELGDALYVLLGLANSLDLDAEAALSHALEKVAARVPTESSGTDASSS
jgi:NTP pyrophosphatase (non-canonical NTP hydrolase)